MSLRAFTAECYYSSIYDYFQAGTEKIELQIDFPDCEPLTVFCFLVSRLDSGSSLMMKSLFFYRNSGTLVVKGNFADLKHFLRFSPEIVIRSASSDDPRLFTSLLHRASQTFSLKNDFFKDNTKAGDQSAQQPQRQEQVVTGVDHSTAGRPVCRTGEGK